MVEVAASWYSAVGRGWPPRSAVLSGRGLRSPQSSRSRMMGVPPEFSVNNLASHQLVIFATASLHSPMPNQRRVRFFSIAFQRNVERHVATL
jgi:hypothetical protein